MMCAYAEFAWIMCCGRRKRRTSRELAIIWSSEYGFTVDALELYGEEGRDKLRKAAGRSTYPVIRGLPNGVTRQERSCHYGLNQ